MTDWVKLINVSPDDDSETFFKKLFFLSEAQVAKSVQRFEKYVNFFRVLRFHQAALQQSDLNITIKYNYRYGWHISSCIKSLPDEYNIHVSCTCDADIADPDKFFYNLTRYSLFRCKLCKSFIPEYRESSDNDEEIDEREKEGGESEGEKDTKTENDNEFWKKRYMHLRKRIKCAEEKMNNEQLNKSVQCKENENDDKINK